MIAAELHAWTLKERVLYFEICDGDRVIAQIEKPFALNEQRHVEAEAKIIAATPRLVRQLEAFLNAIRSDALLELDPDLAREADATEALLAELQVKRP
jgi:hypothetical protein